MTPITRAAVSVYTVPTDRPESDGTLEWTTTTIVIVGLELKRAEARRYAA